MGQFDLPGVLGPAVKCGAVAEDEAIRESVTRGEYLRKLMHS